MLSQPGIGMLKQCLPVEFSQTMGVFGEMGRNPIQNNAYFAAMEGIYQIGKVLCRPITGGGRIIAGHLISPGTVERMLRNPHKLHMGEF